MDKHTQIEVKAKVQPLLRISDVMDRLQISRNTLYVMTRDGKIPGYKIGNSVRYKSEDVEKLLTPFVAQR